MLWICSGSYKKGIKDIHMILMLAGEFLPRCLIYQCGNPKQAIPAGV